MLPQGCKGLVSSLCEHLHALAAQWLQPTDPRIKLFATLKELRQDHQWDPQGHLQMAFDAYCRHLWFNRLGSNDMKAYYSYNQASFPRAEPGEFYEKFQGKILDQMLAMLETVDHDLGQYSVATFCLWHTAINYLFQERRYSDSEVLCRELSNRILGPAELDPLVYHHAQLCFEVAQSFGHNLAKRILESGVFNPQLFYHSQLNFDVVKTFHLLGRSQEEQAKSLDLLGRVEEAQNKFEQALLNFVLSLNLRRATAKAGVWDPLLKSILMALISVGTTLGYHDGVEVWEQLLQAMFLTVEENDKAFRAS